MQIIFTLGLIYFETFMQCAATNQSNFETLLHCAATNQSYFETFLQYAATYQTKILYFALTIVPPINNSTDN